jgi:hypothetical protein
MEKRLMKKYRAFTIVAWGYFSGALLVFMSVIPCTLADSKLWHIGPAGWRSICFSAFVTSAFNYALMAEINKVTSPLTVMSAYPWQSICTPLLSFLILNAPLSSSDGLGGFIICLGLFALAFARYKEQIEVKESSLHEKLEEIPGTASSTTESTLTVNSMVVQIEGGGGGGIGGEGDIKTVDVNHVVIKNSIETNSVPEKVDADSTMDTSDPWAIQK